MQLSQNSTQMFYDTIESYDSICIFRHISPDADALGAQFGLKCWLNEVYPDKKVYALGYEGSSYKNFFPQLDEVNDDLIKNSLAIICDVSNHNRIDDQRYVNAKACLLIDHHMNPVLDTPLKIVYDHCGATCEIITLLIMEKFQKINQEAASYLYAGLLADTLRFSISSTTPTTLQAASFLVSCGIDVAKINEANFSTSLKQYRYESYLRSKMTVVDDVFAYIIVNEEEYQQYGLSFQEAKEKVFVLGGIFELKGWALFTQKETIDEQKIYAGSLRSKNTYITDIANRYHGGGHRYACGVRSLNINDVEQLIQELVTRMKENS